MTNEMKLLMALCDALGFDVEKVCVNQNMLGKPASNPVVMGAFGFDFFITAPEAKPIYEYKLTKRGDDATEIKVWNSAIEAAAEVVREADKEFDPLIYPEHIEALKKSEIKDE